MFAYAYFESGKHSRGRFINNQKNWAIYCDPATSTDTHISMVGTSGSNFPFSICWPLDHVLLVRARLQRADTHLQPLLWWGGHDHPHALICVHLTHASFTHSAAAFKLRDEFKAVKERRSQTRGEIIMHSSRTGWAYSFYNSLCVCVFVCVLPLHMSVTASQPPLPEAAVPHHSFTSLFSSSHSLLHFLFQRLGCGFWTTHPFLCLPLLFPPIHPTFPPLHCHNKASLPRAFHRALSSR